MYINKIPIDCIQLFRNALNELFKEKQYNEKVSIIKNKSWNKKGEQDIKQLYLDDGLHLNNNGYTLLDSVIVESIVRLTTINKRTCNEDQILM